jgi:hypothetical protein
MFDKLVPKLPAYAVFYWDSFLGICFVLGGLAAFFQKVPYAIGVLLCGFGLIAFSMARRCCHHIGGVRRSCQGYWPEIRKQAYPTFFFLIVWAIVSWVCFRYAALDLQITVQWVRWLLFY